MNCVFSTEKNSSQRRQLRNGTSSNPSKMSDATTDKIVKDSEMIESANEDTYPSEDEDKKVTFSGYCTIPINTKIQKLATKRIGLIGFIKN